MPILNDFIYLEELLKTTPKIFGVTIYQLKEKTV